MRSLQIYNQQTIPTENIPVFSYPDFYNNVLEIASTETVHCVSYFGLATDEGLQFICCLADDSDATIHILSWKTSQKELAVESLTEKNLIFYMFEREIHENFGINFLGHPWLKPVRYAWNRKDIEKNYCQLSFLPYRK